MSLHVAQTPESTVPPHVDDGDLLRFEDAELAAADRTRVTLHLAGCVRCSDRRSALLAIAARLHTANRAVILPSALATPPWEVRGRAESYARVADLPARQPGTLGRRATGIALRAGAALGLLAAAAAAAPPLREWLAAHLQRSSTSASVAGPLAERRGGPGTAGSVISHTAEVSFVATSVTLTITLKATSGDSIEVRATTSEAVHVRGRATMGEPTFIVMPDGLQLVSPRNGTTTYSVDVPPNVRVVEVRHDARVLARLAREVLEARGAWWSRLP